MLPPDNTSSYRSSRPRILVVAPEPYYEDRGTPIAVARVVEALAELDYRADLLTYPVGEDRAPAGVRTYRCANPLRFRSVPVGLSFRKLVLDGCLVPALRRRLNIERYACIHAVEESAFPAVLLGRRHGVPVIYDMQSSLPEQLAQLPLLGNRPVQAALRAAERWLLRRADFVVSSTGLAYRVGELAPATGRAEWCFPHAPREVGEEEVAALRAELGIAANSPVVLYSGNFAPYQGIGLLLSAFAAVLAGHPDAVLVLVGARDEREAAGIREGAPESVRDALRVVTREPRDRIDAYHRMADVLVSPRLSGANLPLKVLDYLATGGAIVATDIPAHRTVLDDENAMLVAPEPVAVAQGIGRALADARLRGRLGRAAARYAGDHLGWETFVSALGAVYARVVPDSSRGGSEPSRGGREARTGAGEA